MVSHFLQCESVVEENDEEILSLVTQEASNFAYKLCTEIAGTVYDIANTAASFSLLCQLC